MSLFLLQYPSYPPFFARIKLYVLGIVITLRRLFPIVLFTANFNMAPLFTTKLTFLLIIYEAFNLFTTFTNNVIPFTIFLMTTLLTIGLFFPVTSNYAQAFTPQDLLALISNGLCKCFATIPTNTIRNLRCVNNFLFLRFRRKRLLRRIGSSRLCASAYVIIRRTSWFIKRRIIRFARISRRTNGTKFYFTTTSAIITITPLTASYAALAANYYLCLIATTVMVRRAIRFVQGRTFGRILFTRPIRLTMSINRGINSFLLIRFRLFGVICRFRRLLFTCLFTNKRFTYGRFLTSSTLGLTRFTFLSRISSNSKDPNFTNASHATTTINVALNIVKRSMISSIYRIIRVRTTYNGIHNGRRL